MTPASRSGGNTTRTTQASPTTSPKATATPTTAHAACPQRRKVASHPCSVMSYPFSRLLEFARAGAPDDPPASRLRRPPSVHQLASTPMAGAAATHSAGSWTLGASGVGVSLCSRTDRPRSVPAGRTGTRSDEYSQQAERDAEDDRRRTPWTTQAGSIEGHDENNDQGWSQWHGTLLSPCGHGNGGTLPTASIHCSLGACHLARRQVTVPRHTDGSGVGLPCRGTRRPAVPGSLVRHCPVAGHEHSSAEPPHSWRLPCCRPAVCRSKTAPTPWADDVPSPIPTPGPTTTLPRGDSTWASAELLLLRRVAAATSPPGGATPSNR
jgi:hypothetical protein